MLCTEACCGSGSLASSSVISRHTILRECLKNDVEAFAVLVLEHKPKVEPKVVLAFAPAGHCANSKVGFARNSRGDTRLKPF
jgi:hypothetical protein